MVPNMFVLLGCSFIPFFIAYIWFHPKVFGGDNWKEIAGLTEKQAAITVSPLKLGLSILLNFLIAFGLYNLVVHASGVFGLMGADTEAMKVGTAGAFLAEHGQNHANFGHGAFHGAISFVLMVLPILGYAVIFERKSTKYLLVYTGFWIVSMAFMGGVIGQWGWNLI